LPTNTVELASEIAKNTTELKFGVYVEDSAPNLPSKVLTLPGCANHIGGGGSARKFSFRPVTRELCNIAKKFSDKKNSTLNFLQSRLTFFCSMHPTTATGR